MLMDFTEEAAFAQRRWPNSMATPILRNALSAENTTLETSKYELLKKCMIIKREESAITHNVMEI